MFPSRLIRWTLVLALPLAAARAADEAGSRPARLSSIFVSGVDPQETLDEVRLSDAPIDAVLPYLQYLTGRVILRPQALPAPQITVDAQNLTRAEALFALETLLSLNQIGLVPSGDKFLKVVPISSIRTEAPELVTTSLADDPPSGKVVSKLFRLQYLDSTSFQAQIGPLLNPFATVVPFQNSNMVMVTDTVANLQRLEYVVEQVDRQLEIETKFYEIRYAQAAELADQIRSMIESARTGLMMGEQRGGTRGPTAPSEEGQAPPPPTEAAEVTSGIATGGVPLQVVVSSSTSISADTRTNQIIVITSPGNLIFFDDLIAKLDIPADPQTVIDVFYMKHADAVEMGSLLSQFIAGRSGAGETSDRQPRGRERSTTFPELTPEVRDLSRPGGSAREQAVQETVEGVIEAQGSQFSELMTIVPDERTNALVVSGTNNDLLLIGRVIERLDIILAQVVIEAVIAEVNLTDDLRRGLDAFRFEVDTDSGNIDFVSASGVLGGIGLDYARDTSLLSIVYNSVGQDLQSNVNIMAVPSIATTHNREADLIVGTSRPIVTGTQQGDFTGSTRFTSFQFQDVGIELIVKPIIGPNDVVQLEVTQKADEFGAPVEIGDIEQFAINRREANSFLILKDGQVAVLAGLQRERRTKTVDRVFLLGYIPILGELFKNTSDRVEKDDLVIFLRPTVIHNTDEADVSAREKIRELQVDERGARLLKDATGEDVEPQPKDPVSDILDSIRKPVE